jgi:hypothetical protein
MARTDEEIAPLVKLHLATSVWANGRERSEIAAPYLHNEGGSPLLGVGKTRCAPDRNIARWSNADSRGRHRI